MANVHGKLTNTAGVTSLNPSGGRDVIVGFFVGFNLGQKEPGQYYGHPNNFLQAKWFTKHKKGKNGRQHRYDIREKLGSGCPEDLHAVIKKNKGNGGPENCKVPKVEGSFRCNGCHRKFLPFKNQEQGKKEKSTEYILVSCDAECRVGLCHLLYH